ncbi:hypothetical protein Rsub_02176 [Raphidocelis subcapitata]|uniref:Uncharacterized protein n=1 Tax=Raphidocelis subcapitata TaxID=307507 RepID=A0A2V0NPU4_9CHLO|nr:hypothetical protein Rsub_02176 [Raphidocelis subcapitata]|eukprot:GBF89299.1 hypothetical protein Rsub_02176 [Raphidocelis subcapitata]
MVDKRGHEDGQEAVAPESKRPKLGDGAAAAAAAPGAAGAPRVSADMLAKLEKTKKLLQAQKELQEKLKKLPQVAKPAPPAAAAPISAAAAAARAAEIAAKLAAPRAPPPAAPPPPPAAAAAAGAGAPPRPALGGRLPPPLRLDAQGREVDEFGNPVERRLAPVSTLKVNQRAPDQPAAAAAPPAAEEAAAAREDFFDPRMAAAAPAPHRRRRGALEFVEAGTFQKEGELMRLRAAYGPEARRRRRLPAGPGENPNLMPIGGGGGGGGGAAAAAAAAAGADGTDANSVPIGKQVSEAEELRAALPEGAPAPEVEWWDRPLLVGGRYEGAAAADDADAADGADGGAAGPGPAGALRAAKVTLYVEHPIPIEPPAEAPEPPPQPLRLTGKELKKLRTQRRQAREKEKQELVRQGLLEAPKPKVKISNLMRVMGAESAADPTAVEAEVRKQMAERQAAHDDRNVARMLTPAERRDKKARRLFDESGIEALTAVYRVEDLSNGQHRFKVDVNAKENHMSGVMLVGPEFSVVVVEGCAKSLKRYHKLMLRRIDWTQKPEPRGGAAAGGDEEDEDEDKEEGGGGGGGGGVGGGGGGGGGGAGGGGRGPNACHLVWEGVVKEPSFKEFGKHEAASAEAARAHLGRAGVAHYWDAAANFDPSAAPLPSAVM